MSPLGIDEFRADADRPRRPAHAARQQIADTEPLPDLAVRGAGIDHEGGARREDPHRTKAGQFPDHVLGEALREVALCRILGKVGARQDGEGGRRPGISSAEHTSELQSLMRTSYAVFCLRKTSPYKE